MRRPYHVVDRLNLLMPSASVIKLLSNPRILINALACSSGINRTSWVANQLKNLALGINYYLAKLMVGPRPPQALPQLHHWCRLIVLKVKKTLSS